MFNRKIATALVLIGATFAPVASFAGAAESPKPCILLDHKVTAVAPYQVEVRQGHTTHSQLQGAQVFVQAEPGLTAEWLGLTLTRHLAEMRKSPSMKDCAFTVDDVRVEGDPAATSFGSSSPRVMQSTPKRCFAERVCCSDDG